MAEGMGETPMLSGGAMLRGALATGMRGGYVERMADQTAEIREYVYLDWARVQSLAAQLKVEGAMNADGPARERAFAEVERQLGGRRIDSSFDFSKWTRENFRDGEFISASGAIRLMD